MKDVEIHIPPSINTKPLVIGNQVFQSFYDFTLTEKDLETARTELGENDEKKEMCLRKLKEKLLNDENVKYRLDDSYLLRFLRARKYDVRKAYQNVKNMYEMRNKQQVYFILLKEIKSIEELNIVTCLPYADEEGRILLLFNYRRWNPYEISFDQMGSTVANVGDVMVPNPKIQINGVVAIFDFGGLSWKHYSEFLRFGRLWMYISFAINGYPSRIKKIIMINSNPYLRNIYNITKPFLRRKISERIIFLGSDVNDLHQHVNPVLLPKRLNGSLEEEECDMSRFVLYNLPYIKYERSFMSLK